MYSWGLFLPFQVTSTSSKKHLVFFLKNLRNSVPKLEEKGTIEVKGIDILRSEDAQKLLPPQLEPQLEQLEPQLELEQLEPEEEESL